MKCRGHFRLLEKTVPCPFSPTRILIYKTGGGGGGGEGEAIVNNGEGTPFAQQVGMGGATASFSIVGWVWFGVELQKLGLLNSLTIYNHVRRRSIVYIIHIMHA